MKLEVKISADTSHFNRGPLTRLTRSLSRSPGVGSRIANVINSTVNKKATRAQKEVVNAVARSGLKVERTAKENCPVDTGRLRSSINTTVKGQNSDYITATVGTDVEYAGYVEYGSSKAAAQPYLKPALKKNIASIKADIRKAIKTGLDR
jgi:HK97 gp10 family phage protein